MGEQVTATLDDDLYDDVLEEYRNTGKTKSQIVNERVRAGTMSKNPDLGDTLFPVVGQSLFIAGWVIAGLVLFYTGIGVSLLGLSMMLMAKVSEYKSTHNVASTKTALVRVLGV